VLPIHVFRDSTGEVSIDFCAAFQKATGETKGLNSFQESYYFSHFGEAYNDVRSRCRRRLQEVGTKMVWGPAQASWKSSAKSNKLKLSTLSSEARISMIFRILPENHADCSIGQKRPPEPPCPR
jgi:hypothetical protein